MLDVFKVFLKIGLLGFGGPVATIAMMEQEIQHKRQWLSQQMFNQAYTLCKILPGPAAAQMAIYLGSLKGGFWGGLLAGILFILPGSLIAFFLTLLYFHFGKFLSFEKLFYGISPIVLAIIADSLLRIAKPYSKQFKFLFLIFFSFLWMMKFAPYELLLIFLCGLLSLLWEYVNTKKNTLYDLSPLLLLTLLCFKAGALMFGGGFAIIPLLEHHMVESAHWMTHKEFLDGLTIGLITPGPMMACFVFYGYKVASTLGVLAALLAVFVPSFLFIFLALPWVKKLESLVWIKFFVDGSMCAIVGGIGAMLLPLMKTSVHNPFTLFLFLGGFLSLMSNKVSSWILILSGAGLGFIYQLF